MKEGWKIVLVCIIGFIIIVALFAEEKEPEQSNATSISDAADKSTDITTAPERSSDDKKADKLLDKANSAVRSKKYDDAIKNLMEIINKYPSYTDIKTVNETLSSVINSLPSIDAIDLYSEYKENEVKADNSYKNQIIIITGEIGNIGKDIFNDVYITLSDGEKYSLSSVQCYFKSDVEINKVAELKSGDRITIIGKCSGFSVLNVLVKNCYIIE